MQSPFDLFAKGIIEAGLDPACEVSLQHPAALDPLYADALVEPRPHADALLRERGLLGRMGGAACVMDPFSSTPTAAEVHRCVARVSMLRAQRGTALALWIISQKYPRAAAHGWALAPSPAWGDGVYLGAPDAPRVVCVTRLPPTRETLLLRLMGRGETLDRALREFTALPADAWERTFVPSMLLKVRAELRRMGSTAPAEEEPLMRYTEMVAAGKALEAEYRAEGRVEGLRDAVLLLCESLAVPTDEALRARVAAADVDGLRAMIARLSTARTLS